MDRSTSLALQRVGCSAISLKTEQRLCVVLASLRKISNSSDQGAPVCVNPTLVQYSNTKQICNSTRKPLLHCCLANNTIARVTKSAQKDLRHLDDVSA